MGRINLIQGTDSWKAFRNSRITGTDTSSILNMNPFRSKIQLFYEKTGLVFVEETPAMKRGSELEIPAREAYIKEVGFHVEPAVYESNEYPWICCSLDGISELGHKAVEIKSGEKAFREAKKGIIPTYTIPQLQTQMLCCHLGKIDYWAFNGKEGILLECKRDEDMIEKIKIESKKFYDDLMNLRPPKDEDSEDIHSISDEEWNEWTKKTWEETLKEIK